MKGRVESGLGNRVVSLEAVHRNDIVAGAMRVKERRTTCDWRPDKLGGR